MTDEELDELERIGGKTPALLHMARAAGLEVVELRLRPLQPGDLDGVPTPAPTAIPTPHTADGGGG